MSDQSEGFTGRVEKLPFPYTLPNTHSGFEVMRVIEDMDDDCKVHVELASVLDHPKSWGWYLTEIARAIARDYSEFLGENALAEIREGFIKSLNEMDAPGARGGATPSGPGTA